MSGQFGEGDRRLVSKLTLVTATVLDVPVLKLGE
jgi:hypothetical protein